MVDRINVRNRTLFIGDNLDVLRGINSDSVDLIYLNPPRNTGTTHRGVRGTAAEDVEYNDLWSGDESHRDWLDHLNVHCPNAMWPIDSAAVVHGVSMSVYLTFMAVRLLELGRVMKPSGCIYLQSDPRVSHHLRLVMDSIFGSENFKNEIIFKRRQEREGGRRWVWAHDTLLFYTGPQMHHWNRKLTDHDEDYYTRNFQYEDEVGRFRTSPLTKQGLRDDDRGASWKGYDPSAAGRNWSIPLSILEKAYPDQEGLADLTAQVKLNLLEMARLIHRSHEGAEPRYKIYTTMADGQDIFDIVTHIGRIEPYDMERTGWPGQVPLELLKLILEVSTQEGDLVLDPFCGSGTACVASELLKRRWIGIEQTDQAVPILKRRLFNEIDIPETYVIDGRVHHVKGGDMHLLEHERRSPPTRTDLGKRPVRQERRRSFQRSRQG